MPLQHLHAAPPGDRVEQCPLDLLTRGVSRVGHASRAMPPLKVQVEIVGGGRSSFDQVELGADVAKHLDPRGPLLAIR